jgi:hypothetical protein
VAYSKPTWQLCFTEFIAYPIREPMKAMIVYAVELTSGFDQMPLAADLNTKVV